MIILGLGTNLGDRLHHLRLAFHYIQKIPQTTVERVSPIYISDALLPENAPADWDTPYLNLALRCKSTLSPYELLQHTKEIEKKIGRTPEKIWGPRMIDIDILAWDSLIQYDDQLHIPHEHLHKRPFALWPLADVAPEWIYPLQGSLHKKNAAELVAEWGSRFNGNAPLHTRQIAQRIDTPALMGIINVTPDSFSDGGKYSPHTAKNLVTAGAEILDIGAEATGPASQSITHEKEWERLEPALIQIQSEMQSWDIQPKISVDTRHVEVARKALDLGIDWINDVSGLTNPAMQEIISKHACTAVFMHHLGIPANPQHHIPYHLNPVEVVYAWAEKKLCELDKYISLDKLIFDIGIGYGKTAEQSLALINNIEIFKKLGVKLLVGHSRKSFLTLFTEKPPKERDIETLMFSLRMQTVDYLRVHNVEMHARGFKASRSFIP